METLLTTPIQVVLFDLGSTLIYFDGAWNEVFSQGGSELVHALHAAGLDVDPQVFPLRFSQATQAYYQERESEFIEYTTLYVLRDLLNQMGYTDVSDERLLPVLKALYAVSQAHWHVEEDAAPTLQALREMGFRLGIISNAADDPDVQTLVEKGRLRAYFDIVLSSAALGKRKPHPLIFHRALQTWGTTPDRAVMVGDMLGADILGAHNVGMRAIWITRRADRAANRAHEDTIHPDACISSLGELPALLAEWNAPSLA